MVKFFINNCSGTLGVGMDGTIRTGIGGTLIQEYATNRNR